MECSVTNDRVLWKKRQCYKTRPMVHSCSQSQIKPIITIFEILLERLPTKFHIHSSDTVTCKAASPGFQPSAPPKRTGMLPKK